MLFLDLCELPTPMQMLLAVVSRYSCTGCKMMIDYMYWHKFIAESHSGNLLVMPPTTMSAAI